MMMLLFFLTFLQIFKIIFALLDIVKAVPGRICKNALFASFPPTLKGFCSVSAQCQVCLSFLSIDEALLISIVAAQNWWNRSSGSLESTSVSRIPNGNSLRTRGTVVEQDSILITCPLGFFG